MSSIHPMGVAMSSAEVLATVLSMGLLRNALPVEVGVIVSSIRPLRIT
jgi:hypothetical protein